VTLFSRSLASSWAKFVELVFFPSRCQLCSSFLERPGERVVCRSCLGKLKPHAASYCICCGKFFEGAGDPHLCQDCLHHPPPFSRHRSCAKYRGELKDLILLFKYRHFGILGKDLALFAYEALAKEEDLWWDVDAIIPVPLHPKRKKQRGFNQARVIAKELARIKGIELAEGCLVKIKNIVPQTSLEAEQREKNVRGAFRVKREEGLKGKIVLLVDDVYTTGSTLGECSKVLRKAGVKEVRAITVAQA